jgi:hypothetical protein
MKKRGPDFAGCVHFGTKSASRHLQRPISPIKRRTKKTSDFLSIFAKRSIVDKVHVSSDAGAQRTLGARLARWQLAISEFLRIGQTTFFRYQARGVGIELCRKATVGAGTRVLSHQMPHTLVYRSDVDADSASFTTDCPSNGFKAAPAPSQWWSFGCLRLKLSAAEPPQSSGRHGAAFQRAADLAGDGTRQYLG